MPRRRAPSGSPRPSLLAARLLTGPLGFFLAGLADVTVAWGRWAAGALTARLARRLAR